MMFMAYPLGANGKISGSPMLVGAGPLGGGNWCLTLPLISHTRIAGSENSTRVALR